MNNNKENARRFYTEYENKHGADWLSGIPDMENILVEYGAKVLSDIGIPKDAHAFEVFAIKPSETSPTGKEAFIGYKRTNGNFEFIQVPYTETSKNPVVGIMKSDDISRLTELANNIRHELELKTCAEYSYRLREILKRFENRFRDILLTLKTCGISYEPCFITKGKDVDLLILQSTDNGYKMQPHHGSVCTADSILFKYGGKQRKIFWNDDRGCWYYICQRGGCDNASIMLHFNDQLILHLDSEINPGEYC